MKKSGKKLGNEGFSLVELIIGVFILAIIVGPLLHAFLVSAKTTARAQELRNQTMAAQNIVETFDAASINEILQSDGTLAGIGNIESLSIKDPDTNEYIAVPAADYGSVSDDEESYLLNLTNVASSNSLYNAVVELNTADFVTNLSEQIAVDTQMEATFTQPEGSDNPDRLAADEFAQRALIDSGSSVDFSHRMTRTVTISIDDKTDGGVTKYECTAQYHYMAKYSWEIYDTTKNPAVHIGTQTVTYTTDYYSDFYSGDAGEDERLALYFFFYPNYNGALSYDDEFIIKNNDDVKLDVFLIKQLTPDPSDPLKTLDGIAGYENDYNAKVKIEQTNKAKRGGAVLNTNMTTHLVDGSLIRNTFKFEIYRGFFFDDPEPDGRLVKKEQQNRMYSVTVTLYDPKTNEKLMEFDASIIE